MNTEISNNSIPFYRNVCIVMIWCTAIYSSIIQNVLFQIPNGMLILGAAVLVFFLVSNGKFNFYETLTAENRCILYFMVYMLISGLLFSQNKNGHISQWITCMEYLFLQIVITSIIKDSGTDAFHYLLIAEAAALAVILMQHPVDYRNTGRYSIASDVNPNGLGMIFTAGVWAVLYQQQKSKMPVLLAGAFVSVFGYCVVLTGSRKALIGVGLMIILWFIFCFLPSLKSKDFFYRTIAFLTVFFLVVIIGRWFISIYTNSSIAARMDSLSYEVSEGNRSDYYRLGYEILKRNPLFGVGFTGFMSFYGTYSHASLVEIPVSGGIIGGFWYFYAYYIIAKKIVFIYRETKGIQAFSSEHTRIRMIMVLLILMCFYTTCVIHPYQFDSGILFGIIFGETANIANRLSSQHELPGTKKIGSKYIRYE